LPGGGTTGLRERFGDVKIRSIGECLEKSIEQGFTRPFTILFKKALKTFGL
jgi:hypothetical protein